MKVKVIEGNRQRLDGGAMFGQAPRELWQRWIAPDERNRIELACRALLIELENGETLLFDSGVGDFFSPKLRERFGLFERGHRLIRELELAGHPHDTIDHVLLSHLHFDHAGGILASYEEGVAPSLLFPKATFYVGKEHFARALKPHVRDRASFIPELPSLLQQSGRLKLLDNETTTIIDERFRMQFLQGHTPGLILFTVNNIACVTDLIPGIPWVHLPIHMGYDRFSELLVDEKERLLLHAIEHNSTLFFAHDPLHPFARITSQEGRFSATPYIMH